MVDRYLLKIAAPMALVSLLLFGVGALAAWTIHGQQVVTSNLLAREMDGMLATHDFYGRMRDTRAKIRQFVRYDDEQAWAKIPELRRETQEHLDTAKALADSDLQQPLIGAIDLAYRHFWSEFDRINSPAFEGDRKAALFAMTAPESTAEVVDATEKYIDVSREIAGRTNDASRASSVQMRRGFLMLGICGGAGGLLGGLALARAVRRSIVQLEVSVRSTEGKLVPIAGPVQITRRGGLKELESDLARIESQITDLVERVQRSETELLRSEQLAAVGQLAAGIAHEFRNPLMPMKMLVQAALERNDGRGLCGRQLEVVEEEIERLERSIQVFLEFARPVSPEMSEFDIVAVVSQALELVEARAQKQAVGLRRRLPEAPIMMVADVGQIRQVLLNLLLNALDAMPEGGEAAISIRRFAPDDLPAAARSIAWCEIRISDSGTGLADDVMSRVFEPFVTTKETGTGLGLSICKRIIIAHGGEIAARNLPHGGAEFNFRLPCLPASVARALNGHLVKSV
ncbi:MAG TPA: ATP-binding protein [Planctomycetaceae bacterium]|jgi:signal transduction histidine kinase